MSQLQRASLKTDAPIVHAHMTSHTVLECVETLETRETQTVFGVHA